MSSIRRCSYVMPAASKSALKDRKSTRLNSSHGYISYAVFCLKKKKNIHAPASSTRILTPAAAAAHPAARRRDHATTLDSTTFLASLSQRRRLASEPQVAPRQH